MTTAVNLIDYQPLDILKAFVSIAGDSHTVFDPANLENKGGAKAARDTLREIIRLCNGRRKALQSVLRNEAPETETPLQLFADLPQVYYTEITFAPQIQPIFDLFVEVAQETTEIFVEDSEKINKAATRRFRAGLKDVISMCRDERKKVMANYKLKEDD